MDSKTLAMYLGGQCVTKYVDWTDWGHPITLKLSTIQRSEDDLSFQIKPILRPLLSMTEEESQEFLSISWYNKNGKFTKDEIEMFMKPPHHYSTESFLWLLSKGFDILGLIEKGEAIEHVSETLRR